MLENSRQEISMLKSTLANRDLALSASAAELSTLGDDNVKLLDQVSGLVKEMEALEAQKRAQDSAIAHLKRGRGPTAGGGASSAAGNRPGYASGAQRRASPTAPTSLTRAPQR